MSDIYIFYDEKCQKFSTYRFSFYEYSLFFIAICQSAC